MKKALAALLASFVGLFGYQIVDKTIEARVDKLEYQVSSQQEEIESLHHLGKYYVSSSSADLSSNHDISSSTPPSSTDSGTPTVFPPTASSVYVPEVGTVYSYTGRTRYKYRLYYNGAIKYIDPSNSGSINDILVQETFTGTMVESTVIYYNADYYVNITNASRTLINIQQHTSKYYDDDYSIHSSVVSDEYIYKYNVSGIADSALAGKTIVMNSSTAIINDDGSFEIESITTERYPSSRFNSLNLIIK